MRPASTAAALDHELEALRNRYEHTRAGDNTKHEVIEDVFKYYETLVQTCKDNVEARRQEREAAQTRNATIRDLQNGVNHLQDLLNRAPFILVLIDGNGTFFHQNFLERGALGGKEAATTLGNTVLTWARGAVTNLPADTKIVVRVYGNLRGIAEACAHHYMVDSPSRVEEFVGAFNAIPLFDFVDVGSSRSAAHDKVVAQFKLYIYNYHCRHILFAGSYSDKYCNTIQPYMDNEQARLRMTLLEGIPFGPGQKALPVEQLKIPGLFHEAGFVLPPPKDFRLNSGMRVASATALNAASIVYTSRTDTPVNLSSPFGSVTSLDQNSMARVDSQDAADAGGNMWSTVASRNMHRPMKDLTIKDSPDSAPKISRNKYGQRIDITPPYDREHVQKVKKLKACNQHYIGVGCCHFNAGKADKCPHSHSYDFTSADLKTLRVVARETPCKRGSECDDPKCIYGHQCPFEQAVEGSMRGSGRCINGENCRFPAFMHGVDQTPTKITKVVGL